MEFTSAELFEIGEFFSVTGDYEGAIKYYDKILMVNPENLGALNNKGDCLYKQGKYEEGLECLNKALEFSSEYSNGWFTKGEILLAMKRYEEALECFNKTLEIDAGDMEAWVNKGSILIFRKRYEEAIKCFDEALKISPDNNILSLKKKISSSPEPTEWERLKYLWKQMDCNKKALYNELLDRLVEKKYISLQVAKLLKMTYNKLSFHYNRNKMRVTCYRMSPEGAKIKRSCEDLERRLELIRSLIFKEKKHIKNIPSTLLTLLLHKFNETLELLELEKKDRPVSLEIEKINLSKRLENSKKGGAKPEDINILERILQRIREIIEKENKSLHLSDEFMNRSYETLELVKLSSNDKWPVVEKEKDILAEKLEFLKKASTPFCLKIPSKVTLPIINENKEQIEDTDPEETALKAAEIIIELMK